MTDCDYRAVALDAAVRSSVASTPVNMVLARAEAFLQWLEQR